MKKVVLAVAFLVVSGTLFCMDTPAIFDADFEHYCLEQLKTARITKNTTRNGAIYTVNLPDGSVALAGYRRNGVEDLGNLTLMLAGRSKAPVLRLGSGFYSIIENRYNEHQG